MKFKTNYDKWDFFATPNKHYETLQPNDHHKSFYGKAHFFKSANGWKVLQSYDTWVLAIKGKKIIRLWDGYSATTQRHINAMLDFCGIPAGGKKFWESLPVNESVTVKL